MDVVGLLLEKFVFYEPVSDARARWVVCGLDFKSSWELARTWGSVIS